LSFCVATKGDPNFIPKIDLVGYYSFSRTFASFAKVKNWDKTCALTHFRISGFLPDSLQKAKNEFSALSITVAIQCLYQEYHRCRGFNDQIHTRISRWTGLSVTMYYGSRMNRYR